MADISLNVTGSGFYPSGGMSLIITTNTGSVSSFSGTADSSGAVNLTVPISGITNIQGSSNLSVYAIDVYTGADSNTISIPIRYAYIYSAGHEVITATRGWSTLYNANTLITINGSHFNPAQTITIQMLGTLGTNYTAINNYPINSDGTFTAVTDLSNYPVTTVEIWYLHTGYVVVASASI